MEKPLVSVLMPFYDDGNVEKRKYFDEALESVLSQTFRDFEVVLVVSGNADFAKKQAKKSKRIVLVYTGAEGGYKAAVKGKIRGIAAARNLGIKHCTGRFVAFADADDISLPERLDTQLEYLLVHREIGAVGSNMILIDATSRKVGERNSYESDADIRRGFLQFNTIPQPSVMTYRRLIVEVGGYDERSFAEDFDVWVKMARLTHFHNLQVPLIKYRVHPTSGVSAMRLQVYLGSMKVKMKAVRMLGLLPGPKDIAVNLLQMASLFFPESLRRTALEQIRSKILMRK